MNNKTGRNDPCPCGSGKKYKKCCMKKDRDEMRESAEIRVFEDELKSLINNKQDLDEPTKRLLFGDESKITVKDEEELYYNLAPIEVDAIPDYGAFPKDYITFDQKNLLSMNPLELFYDELCYGLEGQMDLEKAATENNLFADEMRNKIQDLKDPESFIGNFDEYYIPVINASAIKKSMEFGIATGPVIFEHLKDTESLILSELFIKMLHFSPCDFRDGILEVINLPPKNPYVLSALCIELSFYDNPEDMQIFWNCYNFFKEYYPDVPLQEGPVIALNHVPSSG
ncbi:YecA family protein [Methanoplanus endosymbiosus]|uniref:SEC-C domain-containing protein n=1 Tax=Methanoplanus endosymbiosus TaxID=33865 RepID=A0A9E7PQW7_9EURY|nr:SEC-C metal-binding domain-containing protein [Methanoplanus endosymbiosus]UUX93171.1 SEC-C domain-containing protein [Methanoplanus endosymbiosus]